MRNIVAAVMVSLDGVVEAPETWTGPYMAPDLGQEIGSTMAQADAMLLGRKTYETFAASFADQSGGMADAMNSTPKYVVSRTLEEAAWENSTLIKGDLAAELARLKQQDGKNINVSGSATLIRSLLQDGLLDELRVLLFPVVVGSGARLFDGYPEGLGLTLTDSTAFGTGVVNLVYRTATA
jgi:dihydrofolate reductase